MSKADGDSSQEDRLYRIRHTLSHLLAAAVLQIRPDVKLGIGPPVDDGFYYDFLTETPFSVKDLPKIEKRMRKLAQQAHDMERSSLPAGEARDLFGEKGEALKLELINDLEADGEAEVSLFRTGKFLDLCNGPHVENTRDVPLAGFRLDRVAGAYWRGDEKRPMLSRIYGLAFPTKEELKAYVERREEAERRDHRKVGKKLDLYVSVPEVGRGLPMLTEKGATIRRVLTRFIEDEEISRGYEHVHTPVLGRKSLYETSGHWEHYKESMYPPIDVDGEDYVLRPMTCPHHFMLFRSRLRSYRELPLRIAEISPMYRKERSGELSGLMRIMGFHLADAHIFVEPDETMLRTLFKEVLDLIVYVMDTLGLTDRCWYRVSLKDDEKEKYIDAPEAWEIAERALVAACDEMGIEYRLSAGDAAFYGPKLDVQMETAGRRDETLFTNQIDLALSERFELEYVSRDGDRVRPWIIHRSSLGCLERTIAFLIEHYAGAFPLWLSPVQAVVLPIADRHAEFAERVGAELKAAGVRAKVDARNESLNLRIRESTMQKTPYLAVIGDREVENEQLTVTNRDTGKRTPLAVADFVQQAAEEDRTRALELGVGTE